MAAQNGGMIASPSAAISPSPTTPAGHEQAVVPEAQPRVVSSPARPAAIESTRDPSAPAEPQAAAIQSSDLTPAPSLPQKTEKPATAAAPAAPAAQIAPALVSVIRAPNGAQHLTVRLEPAELGQVEVHVDRSAGAPVRVDITVQRPETLSLLLRDQPQLQRALDQAGLPADGRSLTFHIAPPSPTTATASHGSGLASGAGGGSGGGTHPGFGGQHSGTPRWAPPANDRMADGTNPTLVRWLRAGIDITA